MKNRFLRGILCLLSAASLCVGSVLFLRAETEEKPLLTVACISDLHCDYGLQSRDPYVRKSFITVCTELSQTEKADVLLVAGDMTSDNAQLARTGGWSYDIFQRVLRQYEIYSGMATVTGQTLWCCGNHDYQAGVYDHYDAYADYEGMMEESCGAPVSVYRQKDDASLTDSLYPEHILGMHCIVSDFDFVIINAPYSKEQFYSPGTYDWLRKTLRGIGADKTVFLLTHYPLYNSRNISTPSYGVSGTDYTMLFSILKQYPNLIYLYGHNHGGSGKVYISDDTFERITSYTGTGSVVNDRRAAPTSFITSFVGSVSYYNYSLNPGSLTESDPSIVQALMIYVYSDRIVFQTKNYGQIRPTEVPAAWTVTREVRNAASPPIEPQKLLLPDANTEAIVYDAALSAELSSFGPDAVTLNSVSARLTGAKETLDPAMKMSLTNLSGKKRQPLEEKLNDIVSDFCAYEITVRQNGSVVSPSGPLRLTLRVPAALEETEETLAAYYLSADGVLIMTDVTRDGSDLSFVLPSSGKFALSARAQIADASQTSSDDPLPVWVWITLFAFGTVACVAAAVLFLGKNSKNKG